MTIWQRNYYEHIVRDENDSNHIREYIAANPLRWELDRENLNRQGIDEVWQADEDIWFAHIVSD